MAAGRGKRDPVASVTKLSKTDRLSRFINIEEGVNETIAAIVKHRKIK